MVGGGWRRLLPEILGQPPLWSEIADFQPIFACSTSTVTRSEKKEKVQSTQIGSPLRAF